MATTGPIIIDDEKHGSGLAGASLVARGGTYPMRALIRCVAQRSNRLWHRQQSGNKQSLFMPQDLHITHIVLYAVRPELAHESLLYVEPLKEEFLYVDRSGGEIPEESLLKTGMIDPISDNLLDAVINTQDDESKELPMKMNLSVKSNSCNIACLE